MSIMPNRKFSIKTTKTKEEIRQIVISNTCSTKPSLFGASTDKPFWGRATDNYFVIRPVIYYSNSFIPTIKLSIFENSDGYNIDIKMRLLTGVIVFMYMWLAMCTIFELIFISIFAGQGFSSFDIVPVVLFAFGYGLMHFSFRLEADKAEKRLKNMLSDATNNESDCINEPNRKRIKKKIKTGLIILSVPLALVGFFGFCMGAVQNNDEISKFYTQRPLNEKSGIAVDSNGNIYVGERETGCVQVYDKMGVFQYGFYFPTGGSGWFAFGIENDNIHLVTAREDSYLVFSKGELISEENIDNDRSQELQKTYNMTDGYYCAVNNEEYMISTFNTVTVRDESGNVIEKFHLKDVPVWPFPIMVYWLMLAVGLIPYFYLVFKTLVSTSKNTNK